MAQPISLVPNTDEDKPISLDTGEELQTNSPAVIDSRSKKIEFALKNTTGKTYEDAMQALSQGQEKNLRDETASTIDMQKSIQQRQLISQMAQRMPGGFLSKDQVGFVKGQTDLAKFMGQQPPTNPDTVLEQYYAGEYLKPMYDVSDQFNKGSFMPMAVKQIPERLKALQKVGESIIAKREVAQKVFQDTKDKYSDQSMGGWLWDQAKSMIPGRYENLLRGNTDKTSWLGGGLRGTALQSQLSELEGLPIDQYRDKLIAIRDKIAQSSPDAAVTFTNAALGQTTSQKTLNNIFTLVDIASIPAIGIGKAMLAGGKSIAVAAAERVALNKILEEKATLSNLATEATKDVVKSTEGSGPTLREVVNAHFGEQFATLDYKEQQARKEYSAIAKDDTRYPNEGLRSQALSKLSEQIKSIDAQKKDLQSWHADHMAQGYDIKLNQDYEPDPSVKAMAGRGDLGAAATQRVTNNTIEDLQGKANPEKQSIEALPSFLQPDFEAFAANPGHGGQEVVNRVAEQTSSFRTNLLTIVKNIMRVQRVPALLQDPAKWTEAIKTAVEAVKDYTKDSYPGIRNSILNISNPRFEPITNTLHMDMIIGRDGEYFRSKLEAEGYLKDYGLADATVDKDGLGWYIKATKPLDETSPAVRDMLLKTTEAVTPDSWLNSFLGWARTPEETLSFENRMQRKLATYNANAFLEFAKETARDIGKGGLKNLKNWKEWERTVEAARTMPDPADATKLGYFFKDGGELDDFYQTNFHRFPTVTEKSAYFAYKRITEYDRVLRSMALYRNKSRVGVESHSLWVTGKDGLKKSSDFFDGVTKNVLPSSEDGIVVMDGKGGIVYQGSANRLPPKLREKLKPAVEQGQKKVIEIYDPEKKPLSGFFNSTSRIRYVVTENSESKGISLADQVPRRGGGHFDYDYPRYIKQANMEFDEHTGYNWYNGDRTLMPMGSGLGKDIVERLNKVRMLIKDNKLDEAQAFATSKDGIPSIPWDQHLGWYNESKGANNQTLPARLSKDEPLRLVDKDAMINNIDDQLQGRYGESFKDGTREGSLARQAQVQYTGERDSFEVHTLTDIGSRHNPIYNFEPAKLVDPITTMNRALSRIINSTFMDDYKIFSVEHWMRDARPYLKGTPAELDRSPFHYFNRAEEYWRPDMPPETYRQLMSNRAKVMQLVGTPNKVDNFLHSAQQALVDSIYGAAGPKAIKLTPSWLLPGLRDPFNFVRSFVFNAKMGLFAIPQFMVHAMTTVNAIGIAGARTGFQGTFAAFLHGMYHVNPGMLDHLDGLASKFFLGWKPGEFTESIQALNRTGFMNVAGEHVYSDMGNMLSSRIVNSGFQKFLDAGQMFFRGGVTSLRSASWHMAYKEFRELNPTGRLLDDDLKRILERADILSHNMTRASTSIMTKGAMSVPAQFYTYQLRLFELMTGSRLTTMEKARLFGTNAAFFGVPAATGLYGYPFGDNLRTHALENGYVAGDKFYTSIAMEGLPSWIMSLVNGGTYYNVGGRYGAQGIGTLEDLTEGDKTMWQIFGGAAYSSLSDVWTQSNGLRTAVMQAIRGEGDYQLTSDDAWGPFQVISSVNGFHKTLAAVNFGNWLTKSGAPLYPTSPMQAVFQGVSGLTDQRATDVWQKSLTLKEHRAYDNTLYSNFQREFTRGTQAMQNKDPEGAKTHIKNAFVYLNQFGYPTEKIPEAVAAAVKNNQSIIDRVDYDLLIKDPRSRDIDTFNKIQSMKQGQQ